MGLFSNKQTDSQRTEKKTIDKIPEIFFGVIVSSTLKSGAAYYYDYIISPATLSDTTPWAAAVKSGTPPQFAALSISEIGNQGAYYSFGVPVAHIPAGFSPKAIPNGTPVLAVRQLTNAGVFKYLIINTQAISGTC